jgi:hypothetical protein
MRETLSDGLNARQIHPSARRREGIAPPTKRGHGGRFEAVEVAEHDMAAGRRAAREQRGGVTECLRLTRNGSRRMRSHGARHALPRRKFEHT